MEMLSETDIFSALTPADKKEVKSLVVFEQIGSTNDYLIENKIGSPGFHVCLAESQTQGKGRRGGRCWDSPPGGIYLSVTSQCSRVALLPRLGLTAAVEVAETLQSLGANHVGVKWPNDICRFDKDSVSKLGGVLSECAAGSCVVGVGLNYARPEGPEHDDYAWTNLEQVMTKPPGRNSLAAATAAALMRTFRSLQSTGKSDLARRYARFDLLKGRRIRARTGTGTVIHGIAAGITRDAELRISSECGVQLCRADEVSIRW